MSDVEVYEMSEDEWEAAKRQLLAQLKEIPDWHTKLADCHIKCSNINKSLAVALWMTLDDNEVKALYQEAAFRSYADHLDDNLHNALNPERTNLFLDRRSW